MNLGKRSVPVVVAGAIVGLAAVGASARQGGHGDMPRGDAVTQAVAVLVPTAKATGETRGTITFTKEDRGVRVKGRVTGLKPGEKHGFHVHQWGDVSSPDGLATGGHFNPTGDPHGAPDAKKRHEGDFGNITAGADGGADVDFVDDRLSFDGPGSILGRGLIVHAKADDLTSQPSGNAGDRIAQGVIGASPTEAQKEAAKKKEAAAKKKDAEAKKQ